MWTDIEPFSYKHAGARSLLRRYARTLKLASTPQEIALARVQAHEHATTTEEPLQTAICIAVMSDLRLQGWKFRAGSGCIQAAPPEDIASVDEEKASVRTGHLLERDAQLAMPSTQKFLRIMERRRLWRGAWHSVYSLMRDGRELSGQLSAINALGSDDAKLQQLNSIIDPYIQVVDASAVCEMTGLKLQDIWRYFRHTWATTYQSTPGRQMAFLVRDRAQANHPVVGIGALGSAIVQLSNRDEWIGWTSKQFLTRISESPSRTWAKWVEDSLEEMIHSLYVADLVRAGIITRYNLRVPNTAVIESLRRHSEKAKALHRLYPQLKKHKAVTGNANVNWRDRAKTHLFTAKRSQALADLLEIRLHLEQSGFTSATRKNLQKALETKNGRAAITSILRRMKARHVGVDMMDITVCGAVAPYNPLLGGKLVAMLMASPEVIRSYSKRYSNSESVIASALAGRAIKRTPRLVLLGTTSLYGVATSQYNRIKIPGVGGAIEYVRLGRTVGYGSYQFSQTTIALMEVLLAQAARGRIVNSIFGEGVNPKLRKVRGALDAVGLPSDLFLRHGRPRLVYGVPLASNFRDVLIGAAKRPNYYRERNEDSSAIANYWKSRWLLARIANANVLDAVGEHTLVQPINHGARVPQVRNADAADLQLALV